MKVSIKDFGVQVDLGNKGMVLDVYDNSGRFLGDLRIGKATLEWCPGKTRAGNGVRKSWENLIGWFSPANTKPARLKRHNQRANRPGPAAPSGLQS
jgi:hypothetical protein